MPGINLRWASSKISILPTVLWLLPSKKAVEGRPQAWPSLTPESAHPRAAEGLPGCTTVSPLWIHVTQGDSGEVPGLGAYRHGGSGRVAPVVLEERPELAAQDTQGPK